MIPIRLNGPLMNFIEIFDEKGGKENRLSYDQFKNGLDFEKRFDSTYRRHNAIGS